MPLQATSGAASYDAFGGGVPVVPNYIEEVFSTWLYTGTGSAQTITNGVDLSTKGGLVWVKNRSSAVQHFLFDTSRGMGFATQSPFLSSNLTDAQTDAGTNYIRADTTGFSYGSGASGSGVNAAPNTYVSWTFRKQPKFFDVVTFTTNSSGGATGTHSLGSTPGAVFIKNTASAEDWLVWHTSIGDNFYIVLNSPSAKAAATGWISPSSSALNIANSSLAANTAYVAYVFASNAGGFGLTGTDNVISCGSYYNSGSAPVNVTLGYEPQWILIKKTDSAQNWFLVDTMRGDSLTAQNLLKPNLSDAENVNAGAPGYPAPTATGFTTYLGAEGTFIYIAIRRGPMRVPTVGTSVFIPIASSATTGTTLTTGFPVDLSISQYREGEPARWEDRLRGVNSPNYSGATPFLRSDNTASEATGAITLGWDNTSIQMPSYYTGLPTIFWNIRRAPNFFDEVCYIGTGTAGQTYTHNLGVAPELMIVKNRTTPSQWLIYQNSLGNTQYLLFTTAASASGSFAWNNTSPTSSVFSVGTSGACNTAGENYAAYLFATCAGVSKVFSYTGNGSSQTINCGFTGGARWILIKRTDSTGDWYVWDSARGIVSGNDPHLSLNTTAAEVTTDDTIDTDSTGFVVNQVSATNVNVSSATYIGIAIA